MAIDFPNSPTLNQEFVVGDKTWTYDGQKWIIKSVSGLADSTNLDYIGFDTAANWDVGVGEVAWDNGEGTLVVGLNGGNVNLQVGQENVALCYNGTGAPIPDGAVVYISGAQGQRPRITLAQANAEATSSKVLGIATETIANGAEGFVATFGVVNGLNTSAFTAGDALWLSPTVAGGLTATKPTAPNHLVFIGYAISINASSGRIFVNPQNGYELDELHDVLMGTKADRDVLMYESSTGLWKNEQINLGTDTVGNYVASVSGTDGVSISGTGEGAAVTIANSDKGSSQNIFKNVAVSGQSDIVADSNNDTLTFAGGTGITLTTNATTDTLTITNSDTGSAQNIFKNITDGTNIAAADSNNDTFTLTPSTGIGIVVNATTDTATFTNTGVTSFSAGTTGLTPSTGTTGAVTLAGTLAAANGGTGQSSYAVGDLLYASSTTALSKLADVATGNALISGGVGVAPSWGKIGLTTHVTGTLGVGNGGTGLASTPTNGQLLIGNGTNYTLATLTQGTGITVTNASGSITVANAGVTSVSGTANEVEISASTGSVTIGLPNDVTIGNNLTVTGTLTVNGTTTTVNSTTLTVDDPIITLGGDTAPVADDNKDRGIEFRYYDTQARVGFMGWDDSASAFVFLTNATNTSEVFSGTKGTIDANISGSNINAGTVSATYIDSAIARLDSPTFTGTVVLPSTTSIGNVSSTEIGYLDGVTSSIQTQLGNKQPLDADLTAIAAIATTGILKRTGSDTWTTITDNSTNWDSAYTQRLQWDGGSTNLVAATGRTSLGATTVGSNLFTLTNPSAITFPKINADNTVTAESAATHRTSIGATTVGSNLFTLTNPSAITFLRVNADNTVSALNATDFRTAIGAGTSSTTGTVTSVGMTVPTGLSVTPASITTSGTFAISLTAGYEIPTTTALAAKAPLASPTFTGTVTIPTLSLTTADTATTASHYFVETASDGVVRPKTLANVRTEIVTTAAVNSAAATTVGTITSGVWQGSSISTTYTDAKVTSVNGQTGAVTISSSGGQVTATEPSTPSEGYMWVDVDDTSLYNFDFPTVIYSPTQPTGLTGADVGTIWVDEDSTFIPISTRWTKIASGGETTLSGTGLENISLVYTPGYEQVFLNGVLLTRNDDYIANNGTSILLTQALTIEDVVHVMMIEIAEVADTYTQAQIDAKIGDAGFNPFLLAGM